jgi:CAAX protease family protein
VKAQRTPVAFFVLTYLVSWTIWIATNLLLAKEPSSLASLTGVTGVLLLIGTIAPSLVALALTARETGPDGVRALLSRIVILPTQLRWYVFAAGFMASVKLCVVLLHRILAGSWPAMGETPWYIMAVATVLSTPVQAGEEIGWRGYALPRLSRWRGLPAASVILGVIWACWHLPLFFVPGANAGESFPMYLFAVTAISIAMAWLYWRTNGSLLLTMLMHAASNNTASIVRAPAAANPFALRPSLIGGLTVVLLWIPATYFLVRMSAANARDDWEQRTDSNGLGSTRRVQLT